MRVGVYVDGYNLYYGGRRLCGRSTAGWRWLHVRALAEALVAEQAGWSGAVVEKVVYCTARVDAETSPSAFGDQDVYLKAIVAGGAVDHIEYGNYVARVKTSVLATKGDDGKPVISTPAWPVMIQSSGRVPLPDAHFMVSYLHTEEKGSDVNVATHLLKDVLEGNVDAAVVVTNDSDLGLPVRIARERVPVGLVNPGGGYHAGALQGSKDEGAGNHWFRKLAPSHFRDNQLEESTGGYVRPAGW